MNLIATKKQALLIILMLALLVNLGLYFVYGVKIVNDTPQYLYYSDLIKNGQFYRDHYVWYVGYASFISFLQLLSPHPGLIVIFQIIIYGAGLAALFDASFNLFSEINAAFITCLIYIFFIEIPTWNFYLLPESLFTSCICICIACLIRYDGRIKNLLILIIITGFTFSIKPTGITLLVIFALTIILYHKKDIKISNTLSFTLWSGVIALLFFLGNYMLKTFVLIENYCLGEIIYGITTLPNHPDKHLLMIDSPDNLVIPPAENIPMIRVLQFAFNNPVYFMKLSFSKLFYLLAHIKPYYSAKHNIFIILFLFPVYYFACRMYFQSPFNLRIKVIFLIYILCHLGIVMLTVEDWDGRFIMPLMPVISIMAGKGIHEFLLGLIKPNSSQIKSNY